MIDSLSYEFVVSRIVDADTIHGIKRLTIYASRTRKIILEDKIKLRLLGIDAPETRGKRKSKKGIEAADYVKSLLPKGESFQYLFSGKKDSFGRELGDIMLPGERPLGLHLVSMEYAKEMKY